METVLLIFLGFCVVFFVLLSSSYVVYQIAILDSPFGALSGANPGAHKE
jgi:Na+-transporting methylmalonyl-CoA/oxaloacetate decarboxylase gamma subunit